MTNNLLVAYLIYLPIALGLTFYVAHSLFKNSTIYMLDIFKGRTEIALATNTLFKIGFYLLNMGFALFILQIDVANFSTTTMVEILSKKIGGFSIYLGFMLFFNVLLFFKGKRASSKFTPVNTLAH